MHAVTTKLTTNLVAKFCTDAHPEAGSQVEAMDIHIDQLFNKINFKLKMNQAAADDIELYFILCSARTDLLSHPEMN